jgi:tRNA/rRNA methyltransferase
VTPVAPGAEGGIPLRNASPVVVLVGVQLAENLGAVARVMGNFGLPELRLVAPQADPADPRAVAMATHAATVLTEARRFDALADALADRTHAWGTAALPRQRAARALAPRTLAGTLHHVPGRHALVFGPERTGLTDADLVGLDGVVRIPTAPAVRALNLAQAVAVLAWEWHAAHADGVPTVDAAPAPAPRAAFEAWFARWSEALVAAGWLTDDVLRVRALDGMRAAFRRAGFTEDELSTLHGAVRALARRPT